MLTKKDCDWCRDIINTLMDNDFKSAISYHKIRDEFYRREIEDWKFSHENLLEDLGVNLYYGATKACLVPYDGDWVIKVSFIRSTDPEYVRLNSLDDYCEKEAEYYEKACEADLENYFAATYYVDEINGVKVFIQEKAMNNEDEVMDSFYSYTESSFDKRDFETEDDFYDAIWDEVDCLEDEDRIHAMVGFEKDVCKLIRFIRENHINDLHSITGALHVIIE